MSELPPPYVPHPPSAPGFPSAFSTQPAAFPGSPYQTFPQSFSGGGDQAYYQASPMFPPGAFMAPPTSHSYLSGQQHHLKAGGDKHPVFVVEQNRHDDSGGGAGNSCLAACSAALCCCCLWDMISRNLC